MKRKIALALVAGVILSSGGGGYAYACTKAPVAYVSMDINPSVELGVNAFDKVVSVVAYNKDGKKILEGTDLVNSKIYDAVNIVISNAISEGYINEDGSSAIEITTSTDKDDVAIKLDESLKEAANKTLGNNNVDANVETEKVALARRDEARKLGITPGKLNLIQKLQELDPTISVDDYKDSSVKNIQKKTKELRKNNNSDETTKDESTNTDLNNNAVTDLNANVVTDKNTNDTSNNSKKEENSNSNSKKDESTSESDKEKDIINTSEKQNDNSNLISQKNNNSNSQNDSSNKEKNKNN